MPSNLWPITSHLLPHFQEFPLKGLGMRLNGTKRIKNSLCITRLLLIHVLKSKLWKRVGVSTQICFWYLSLSLMPKKEKYTFRVLDKKINYFFKLLLRDTPLRRTETVAIMNEYIWVWRFCLKKCSCIDISHLNSSSSWNDAQYLLLCLLLVCFVLFCFAFSFLTLKR